MHKPRYRAGLVQLSHPSPCPGGPSLPHLTDIPAVVGGRCASLPAECGSKRAGAAETQHYANLRHRNRALCQQQRGILHAAVGLVPMRWHSERLLEGPAEIVPAQADELRKRVERYPLRKMFLDVGGDDPLLPRGEPTPDLGLHGGHPGVETDELVYKHDAKSVKIEPIFRPGAVDQAFQ